MVINFENASAEKIHAEHSTKNIYGSGHGHMTMQSNANGIAVGGINLPTSTEVCCWISSPTIKLFILYLG